MGRLLLRWVVCEADALCDIALQAFYASLKECLFALVEVGQGVVCLLCAGGLFLLAKSFDCGKRHTPSSTGTEKNSQPVSLKISSPPGIPCR